MSTCKVAKILAFTSMEIPTNTYIRTRLTIVINGFIVRRKRYYSELHSYKKGYILRCNLLFFLRVTKYLKILLTF